MIKIHYQDDQDALFKACAGQMSRLIDTNALIKSAASEAIPKSVIEQFKPDKDHFLEHMIIVGDSETYSQNKNGDAFTKRACQTYHPTFVTHGAYYREHNHRSKSLAIGQIKYATHNEPMARTELLVWGNIKKAEDIYEAIKSGKGRSNSMSCRVPEDRCSICDHRARSPEFYCKHAKERMNQWIPEALKYAYVFNDKPTFFDASDVEFPADRLAHYLEYRFPSDEGMRKAASTGLVVSGVEWAKFAGATVPDCGRVFDGIEQVIFEKMAAEEVWLRDNLATVAAESPKRDYVRKIGSGFREQLSDTEISTLRTMRLGTMFGELAKRACILPFNSFVSFITNRTIDDVSADPIVKNACCMLNRVFSELADNGCNCGDAPDAFAASSPGVVAVDAGQGDPVNQIFQAIEDKCTMRTEPLRARVMRITITKSASELVYTPIESVITPETENQSRLFAGLYGLYKVAALADISRYAGMNVGDVQITNAVISNFYP